MAIAAQYEALRQKLLAERDRLTQEIALEIDVERVIAEGEGEEGPGEIGDDASELFEQEKEISLQRHLERMLAEVNHALHKFFEETYGRCDECGAVIPPERLEAWPQAALCISCQARHEKARRLHPSAPPFE